MKYVVFPHNTYTAYIRSRNMYVINYPLSSEPAVHGQWGQWSDRTECGVTCGGGTISRSRMCDNPEPEYNGDECDGLSLEEDACATDKCPGQCVISKRVVVMATGSA